ncbi:amino acid adenylation domain-containing protein [Vibrio sp. Of7-15]|uniref:amino acid adenylation domain-containing protein n=1 Tax=Vibrio sp. Of7-15 TaxID=2724879 RepID=UPI001EF3B5D5|nr:amino acid adenylation domain-containing protein [Vibrio sp. Of7-15]
MKVNDCDGLLTLMEREIFNVQVNHLETPCFNLGSFEKIHGTLDTAHLKNVIRRLISREEVFYFGYTQRDGAGVRFEGKYSQCDILEIDHTSLPSGLQQQRTSQLLNDLIAQPFDLENPPLYRFIIVKHSESEHTLAHIWHHLIMDGMGFNLFHQKVIEEYNQSLSKLTFNELSIQSLAIEEQEYWRSDRKKKDEAFWKQFSSKKRSLIQPILPPMTSNFTWRNSFHISPDVWARLVNQSKVLNCTVQHLILLTIQLCFADSRGQRSITVGRPTHRRHSRSLREKVGHFAGLSLVHIELNPSDTLSNAVDHLKTLLKKDLRHQKFPISRLSREFHVSQNKRQQIYDVLFSYEPMKFRCHYGEAEGDLYALCHGHELSPVAIYLRDYYEEKAPVLDVQLNLEYFKEDDCQPTVDRIIETLARLSELTADARVGDVPLLTKEETNFYQSLQGGDATADITGLCETLEKMAKDRPDDIAVMVEDGASISYSKLSTDVLAYARKLHQHGVTHCSHAGLLYSRSYDMLVYMLAVNRLGATYVPISKDLPKARIQSILNQLKPAVVITDAGNESALTQLESALSAEQIAEEQHQPEVLTHSWLSAQEDPFIELPPHPTEPFNAYILFTSGTTGEPKGVIISSDARDQFLFSISEKLSLNQHCCIAALTSPSFDISVLELFAPMIAGGTVFIINEQTQKNPRQLAKVLQSAQLTHIQGTPTTWQMLQGVEGLPMTNAIALVGGEPISNQLVKALTQHGLECWNMYGPTESTVWVMAQPIETESSIAPIGGLLNGCQAHVRDEFLRILPPGVNGELVLSGATLSVGYLHQQALTDKVFVTVSTGQRAYKTGDLVTLTRSGEFEFHGRADSQCKIRGHRIELGEIENTLSQSPAITRCTIVAHGSAADAQILCFFQGDWAHPEILAYLRPKLPDYMLPSHSLHISDWPVNVNGKTDRNTLLSMWQEHTAVFRHKPPLDQNKLVGDYEQQSIENQNLEEMIPSLWQQVLAHPVQLNDNFFDVGGNSVKASQLRAVLEQHTQHTLSDTFVFEHPSPRSMIAELKKQQLLTNQIENPAPQRAPKQPDPTPSNTKPVGRQRIASRKRQRAGEVALK